MNAAVAPLAAQRKRRARWAIVAVVVIVVAAVAIAAPLLLRSTKTTTTAPATVAAESRTITQVVSGSGSTVAAESVTVNPEVSGTVEHVYVSEGETVTAGQKLYTVSSDDADAALLRAKTSLLQASQQKLQASQSLGQANNQLYSAKTQQIQQQQTLDRLLSKPATSADAADQIAIARRQLASAKNGVTSASTGIQAAKLGVESASASYTSAKRSYDQAATDVGKTVVTAPIDGTITSLPLSVGDYVSAGVSSGSSSSGGAGGSATGASSSSSSGSSVVIANLADLSVDVSVSEVDVPDLSVGMEATITIDALSTESFTGVVKSISPNGTSSSGVVNYAVQIELGQTDKRLRPDMTATADIVTRVAKDAVAVPNSAIRSDGTTKYVQTLDSSGATQKVVVKIGVSDEQYTQVTEGLSAGDKVLTASSTGTSTQNSFRGGGMMMGGGPPRNAGGGN